MKAKRKHAARACQGIDVHIAARLRQRRTELGLKQDAIARAINVTYQQVQKYEAASNRISASRLYEIATLLDVDIGFFFQGIESLKRRTTLERPNWDRAALELAKNFQNIADPSIRASIVALVKALTAKIRVTSWCS